MEEEHHRRQAHERTVACSPRTRGTGERLASCCESRQCGLSGHSDVKALTRGAQVTVLPPVQVTAHLVAWIKPAALEEALRQAECHRRVVGPFTALQLKGASALHIGQWGERASWFEFQGRSHGITAGETQKCSPIALKECRRFQIAVSPLTRSPATCSTTTAVP